VSIRDTQAVVGATAAICGGLAETVGTAMMARLMARREEALAEPPGPDPENLQSMRLLVHEVVGRNRSLREDNESFRQQIVALAVRQRDLLRQIDQLRASAQSARRQADEEIRRIDAAWRENAGAHDQRVAEAWGAMSGALAAARTAEADALQRAADAEGRAEAALGIAEEAQRVSAHRLALVVGLEAVVDALADACAAVAPETVAALFRHPPGPDGDAAPPAFSDVTGDRCSAVESAFESVVARHLDKNPHLDPGPSVVWQRGRRQGPEPRAGEGSAKPRPPASPTVVAPAASAARRAVESATDDTGMP